MASRLHGTRGPPTENLQVWVARGSSENDTECLGSVEEDGWFRGLARRTGAVAGRHWPGRPHIRRFLLPGPWPSR